MGISIEQFIQKYRDKTCTHPRGIAGECVCLYRCYLDEVLGVPQSPPVVGARMIWNTYSVNHFTRISRTSIFSVPRKGDIFIMTNFPGNVYGHVGIILSAGPLSFTSFDSNWSVRKKAKIELHSYRYVLGWLRPRIAVEITDADIKREYRRIWQREPAYGDWFYFRKRIELGTIKNNLEDVRVKMAFTYGKFKTLGDSWWQAEKRKVLG